MLYKTRGIALNYIRFRESSIIVKIYTELFGIQSYIVNGVRSSKVKNSRIALFQPLTLLDMVVYHKNKAETMHRISEIKCSTPYHSIPFNLAKSGIALFLTEILVKTLREEESNEPLFEFLVNSLEFFDTVEADFENFHIQFLFQLAAYLGFGITSTEELDRELRENHYPLLSDAQDLHLANSLHLGGYTTNVKMDRVRRNRILEKLIFFYKIHMESLGEIKSVDILREVLN